MSDKNHFQVPDQHTNKDSNKPAANPAPASQNQLQEVLSLFFNMSNMNNQPSSKQPAQNLNAH